MITRNTSRKIRYFIYIFLLENQLLIVKYLTNETLIMRMEPVFTSTRIPTIGQRAQIIGLSSFRNAVAMWREGVGSPSLISRVKPTDSWDDYSFCKDCIIFCIVLASTVSFHDPDTTEWAKGRGRFMSFSNNLLCKLTELDNLFLNLNPHLWSP